MFAILPEQKHLERCSGTCGLRLPESALMSCEHCQNDFCLSCLKAHWKQKLHTLVQIPKLLRS